MERLNEKAFFLRNEYLGKLTGIPNSTRGKWGKMTPQQMVEHMADSVRVANGKNPHTIMTAEEQLPAMTRFLESEKPFWENTPNRLMGEFPEPVRNENMAAAIEELRVELDDFFKVFEDNPDKTITNPFFGDLDYDHWVQLLHKHAWHHLKQFGVEN